MIGPIPEVERTVSNQLWSHLSNIAMLVMVGVTCLIITVGALVLFAKIDGKVSTIRTVQVQNTARSNCQDRALNAVLKDARLALQGDRNPADYAVAPKC
jgi:hypothetical protein